MPCRIIAADVSDEQECRLLYEAVQSEELEVVINNAGFGLFGEFVTADLDEELRMIDTNVRAVHILTKLAVRDFVQRGCGYILNVSSLGGIFAGTADGDLLRHQKLCSAPDRKPLREGAAPRRLSGACVRPSVRDRWTPSSTRSQACGFRLRSVGRTWAREAADGLFAGKAVVVPGAAMKAMTLARHFAPDSILARITYHFQHKKGAK